MTPEIEARIVETVAKIIGGDDSAFIEPVAEALRSSGFLNAVEALEKIKERSTSPTPTSMDDRLVLDWIHGRAATALAKLGEG